jgi:hypothetical protein
MRKAILMSVAILGFSWPAAAQEEFAPVTASITAASAPMFVWEAPLASPGKRIAERSIPAFSTGSVTPKTARRDFSISNRVFVERASGMMSLMSMYEYTETPFVEHVSVPVISLAGGRVRLGGYMQMTSSENFQMGLPGCGTLPAWGIGTQSHQAVTVPRADASAGFNISFQLRGNGSRDAGFHPMGALSRAFAFLRGI